MPNQASDRLKRNINEIMKRWEARAYEEIAATMHQASLALRNSLPEYLGQLVDALSTTKNRSEIRIRWDRKESLRIGNKHGHERAQSPDYTMDQVIFEYQILRQVICEVMEEEAPLSPIEREIIVCSVEQAVNDAATQFSATLAKIQEQLTRAFAHDLRSPLMVAKTGAILILRRPDDADHCTKVATRISANMDHLEAMLKDLLDVSLLKAGQQLPMRFEECDLNQVARQVADDFDLVYGDRFVIDADPVKGYWDAGQLRRVLENLATNAVKYGDSGTPITLELKRSGDRAILSVHNYGKSIPPEERAILFQQFRRTRPDDSSPGWGLGLTVVKGIVEAHQGTINVESDESEGTTFVVELPTDLRSTKAATPGTRH
jgi:signal transduction histidine kinase